MEQDKQSADHDPDANSQSTAGFGEVKVSSVVLINDRWLVLRLMDSNNCANVFEVLDKNNNSDRYAMKTESVRSESDTGRLPQVIYLKISFDFEICLCSTLCSTYILNLI